MPTNETRNDSPSEAQKVDSVMRKILSVSTEAAFRETLSRQWKS
jgi:hypothetical protein